MNITRRRFLLLTGATALAPALPGCSDRTAQPAPHFFTTDERATIEAACEALFPPDHEPGARELGAAEYLDRFLAAFDVDPPLIYARGPFSGRAPYPDPATGGPSDDFPRNDFVEFLPLEPIEELAWRIRLYGSQNVPGGDFNDAFTGGVRGLREIFREGAAALEAEAQARFTSGFADLTIEQRGEVIAVMSGELQDTLLEQTACGLFAAPEYGGNRDLGGWSIIGFDGDSQPLGHSLYDPRIDDYRENPDRPVSTADPDDDLAGISAATRSLLTSFGFVDLKAGGEG